jgi:hypothetical protein
MDSRNGRKAEDQRLMDSRQEIAGMTKFETAGMTFLGKPRE